MVAEEAKIEEAIDLIA
jgi:hypothetical protein